MDFTVVQHFSLKSDSEFDEAFETLFIIKNNVSIFNILSFWIHLASLSFPPALFLCFSFFFFYYYHQLNWYNLSVLLFYPISHSFFLVSSSIFQGWDSLRSVVYVPLLLRSATQEEITDRFVSCLYVYIKMYDKME